MPPLSPQNETTTTTTTNDPDKPEIDDAAKTLNQDSCPPPQTETTSLKPETDDAEKKPPSENETNSLKPETDDAEKKRSENETTSLKPETDDAEKKPPSENETNSLKPESDDAEKKPSENETTSLKPETNDAEKKPPSENETNSLKPETDDAEKKPSENEPTSLKQETDDADKKPPPETETTSLKPETGDAEKKPLSENDTTSTTNDPAKTTTTETNKPETDDAERKPPSDNETTSTTIDPAKTTSPTNKPEVSPLGNNSTPPSQITAAQEAEIEEEDKTLEKNAAAPKISPPDGKSNDPQPEKAAVPRPTKKASSPLKKVQKMLKCLNYKSSVPKQGTESKPNAAVPSEKERLSELIQEDLKYIKDGADKLKKFHDDLEAAYKRANQEFTLDMERSGNEYLHELRKDLVKLKLQVPSKFTNADNLKFLGSKFKDGNYAKGLDKMPWLPKKDVFKTSLEFKDFEARYKKLPRDVQLCLLCFSIFPENDLIKKRLMVQWWVVEGYASDSNIAGDHFDLLIQKGFIEPVNKNGSPVVGLCQIRPFYRSALVVLSERARFFNFDARGEPTQNFSKSFQVCLVGQGVIALSDRDHYDMDDIGRMIDDLEKVHLLINVKEISVEFRERWFSKMKNVNYLHLGRWSVSPTDNREVQDTEFLDGFKSMSCLKFLSLQGISYLFSLPQSISYLTNLKILDLRACHNLETITDKIKLLKNLTHLDMSECYLLDRIPKCLSTLIQLRVIKGFVVGDAAKQKDSCTLTDLEKLPELFKLCIYTSVKDFPEEEDLMALGNMKELRKLTITWGGEALQDQVASNNISGEGIKPENSNNIPKRTKASRKKKKGQSQESPNENSDNRHPILPSTLEKLDLKCFPMSNTPDWLALDNLKELKKLYIRGGKFSDLGQFQDIDNWSGTTTPVCTDKKTWKVEVLRLKYLADVEMEWTQHRELFPDLVYLEQASCPKLTLFPCDADGVWKNKTRPS